MDTQLVLDESVIRLWSDHCARYRRNTSWLWFIALLATLGPVGSLFVFGAVAFIPAFALFAVGLLIIGVSLSRQTPLLFCPHCGERPKLLMTRRYPSLLSVEYCRSCHYWLKQPSSPN